MRGCFRRGRSFKTLVLLPLAALVLWSCLRVGLSPKPRAEGRYSREVQQLLQVGHPRAVVEVILGGPPGNYSTRETRSPSYRSESRSLYVWWEDDFSAIGVQFDKADRVELIRGESRIPTELLFDPPLWRKLLFLH